MHKVKRSPGAAEEPFTGQSALNPLGYAFENYNGIGAYQTTDGGKPVDASGSIDVPPELSPARSGSGSPWCWHWNCARFTCS